MINCLQVIFLGIFSRRVPEGAALVGLVGGLATMTFVSFGTDLAWPWFALVGSTATCAIGLAAESLLVLVRNNR